MRIRLVDLSLLKQVDIEILLLALPLLLVNKLLQYHELVVEVLRVRELPRDCRSYFAEGLHLPSLYLLLLRAESVQAVGSSTILVFEGVLPTRKHHAEGLLDRNCLVVRSHFLGLFESS